MSNSTDFIIKDGILYSYTGRDSEIQIPEGVKEIDSGAFYKCYDLKSIYFPDSIKSLYDFNTYNLKSLNKISIPFNLKYNYGYSDSQLDVNENVSVELRIGRNSTAQTPRLFQNYIQPGISSMGITIDTSTLSFDDKKKVTSIKILNDIDKEYLEGLYISDFNHEFPNLSSFDVDINNPNYRSLDGALYSHDMSELICYPRKKKGEFKIPDSVKKLEEWSYSSSELTKLFISKNVNDISDFTFSCCKNLKEIIVDKNNSHYCSYDGALYNKDMKKIIYIPEGKKGILKISRFATNLFDEYDNKFSGLDNITYIDVENGNLKYSSDNNGFLYNKRMTKLLYVPKVIKTANRKIIIPNSISDISGVYFNCENIDYLKLSSSIKKIEHSQFSNVNDDFIIEFNNKQYNFNDLFKNDICSITVNNGRFEYEYYQIINFGSDEYDEYTDFSYKDEEDDEFDNRDYKNQLDSESWDKQQEQIRKELAELERKKFEDNCTIIKSIQDFGGKTFVATGLGDDEAKVKEFLLNKGAYLRGAISGKTDYLIVNPEGAGERKYEHVLEQAQKGHIIEVIFYEDFIKYME